MPHDRTDLSLHQRRRHRSGRVAFLVLVVLFVFEHKLHVLPEELEVHLLALLCRLLPRLDLQQHGSLRQVRLRLQNPRLEEQRPFLLVQLRNRVHLVVHGQTAGRVAPTRHAGAQVHLGRDDAKAP